MICNHISRLLDRQNTPQCIIIGWWWWKQMAQNNHAFACKQLAARSCVEIALFWSASAVWPAQRGLWVMVLMSSASTIEYPLADVLNLRGDCCVAGCIPLLLWYVLNLCILYVLRKIVELGILNSLRFFLLLYVWYNNIFLGYV